ncbi:hypothetical protein [Nostoc sp. FACHB-110]|uniref:hypothetical protein n=1 Tax=Nostoc sp. FACHB-110 TaxID=2692834 RepID=UPI001682A6B3|nr:hypothetical protein [Nostoc sp. FACHB-110]MBD2439424.1 hypothetical protein [Nostoc sp. FACHB-110]
MHKDSALTVIWTYAGNQCTMIRNGLQAVQSTTELCGKQIVKLDLKQNENEALLVD